LDRSKAKAVTRAPTNSSVAIRTSIASLASGPERFIGPLLLIELVCFPLVWFAPLLTTSVYFISHNDIVLIRAAYDLFFADKFLFVIVFIFGMFMPVSKMIFALLSWYYFSVSTADLWSERLSILNKLSMLDVMLLAIFIVAFKGIGIGAVQIRFGLYIYVTLIVGSLLLNLALAKAIARAQKAQPIFNNFD